MIITILNEFPKGTKYTRFDKKLDLEVGNFVYASLFTSNRFGKIESISKDKKIVYINNKATFVSDIQYLIIN